MDKFQLTSKFKPKGDQPEAISKLSKWLETGKRDQTLLGVTGSGKTFVMANVIEKLNRPTLVISHNKTLAAQLAFEFSQFFPKNAVHYFVSYYDYYQPEAYIPRTDTYVEKETAINEEIDRLRQLSTQSLLTRRDVLVVASVSCIYGIGSPEDYSLLTLILKKGQIINQREVFEKLVNMQFLRNDLDFTRGTFRARGEVVDIFPSATEYSVRAEFFGNKIEKLSTLDPLTGEVLEELHDIIIFPAKHWVTPQNKLEKAVVNIKRELQERVLQFKANGRELEAQRLEQRTNFDLEMMEQTGFCSGIENYSRHLDGRNPGQPPFSLVDYFPKDFLLFIDESHMTVPQMGGMYEGDRSRKQTLIDYGFRLPSAIDNRPLKFKEIQERINKVVYVSATPGPYELGKSTENIVKNITELSKVSKTEGIAQLVVRPTGILDPEIQVRPTKGQIDDLISEIKKRVEKSQRVLVTTLTKRMAEDLAEYLGELDIKVAWIHSEVETLERLDILRELREGKYDVLVGINLLREGLDLPEVTLVAILDADKEGFLRSETSLIQVIGRTARHTEGKAIMYGDVITKSMKAAISETERRRKIQQEYNKKHNITPKSIKKEIKDILGQRIKEEGGKKFADLSKIPKSELFEFIKDLESQMDLAARNLEFEKAAMLRDQIKAIREEVDRKRIRGKR